MQENTLFFLRDIFNVQFKNAVRRNKATPVVFDALVKVE